MASKKKSQVFESTAENAAEVANTSASNVVTVLCNMPSGISFTLPNGKRITFNGYPVSNLVGPDGEALPAGKYGVTRGVSREDWEWIKKTYAECAFFKPGRELLLAADKPEEARDVLKDHEEVRHGLEQVDVNATNTAPMRD